MLEYNTREMESTHKNAENLKVILINIIGKVLILYMNVAVLMET